MKLHRNFFQIPFTLDRLIKVESYRSLAPAVGHVSSQHQTVIENQTKKCRNQLMTSLNHYITLAALNRNPKWNIKASAMIYFHFHRIGGFEIEKAVTWLGNTFGFFI